MKYSIAGKIYDAVDVQKLSMLDMLLFSEQTAAMGVRVEWDDVQRWHNEMSALDTDAERAEHPKALWMSAVAVWAARRAAGEDVTFAQAVDVPAHEIRVVADPQDRKPKSPGKAKPRTGGGAGAKKAAAAVPTVSVET